MGRMQPSETVDGKSLVLALTLELDASRTIIDWVSIVVSFVQGAPIHLVAVEKALKGMMGNDPRVKKTLADLVPDQIVASGLAEGALLDPGSSSVVDVVLDCYDRAARQAQAN